MHFIQPVRGIDNPYKLLLMVRKKWHGQKGASYVALSALDKPAVLIDVLYQQWFVAVQNIFRNRACFQLNALTNELLSCACSNRKCICSITLFEHDRALTCL